LQRSCFLVNKIIAHAQVNFQPGRKILELFGAFSTRLSGLKIPARFLKAGWNFHPGLNLHVIANFISRGFVSETGLKSQPR
jgi:hypothetical protein